MLYSATSVGYILLVDDMSISERVEYSTLLSFMVMIWMCSVMDTLIEEEYSSHLLVVRFGV